ncbi:aspartate-alanine antiporter [Obesumbacterium proteus]|uniref:Transport protein n=1 Tax=Obesumbacterium proteus ATCC 12841 TaxID=1354268 RepID=A0AA91ECA0_9GAMM|nr:aspartate-alanine antiporter [Obesumbacterium proteus]OAT56615.1 putative transport protein [Obesumbacterium proteus ATCC 12841]
MNIVQTIFKESPDIAFFISLGFGYYFGKIKFGNFQFSGVAGSLIVSVFVSLIGVNIDKGLGTFLFAVFIYAVGFECGPKFFSSLGKNTLKEVFLSLFLAIFGLITVVVLSRIFHLDKGMAAGIAAGGLTQSAIIGTAGSAISKLGLPIDTTHLLQAHVAIGYAVTYIFGSFGTIIICVPLIQKFMGKSIRDDAIDAENKNSSGVVILGNNESFAAPSLVGRVYELSNYQGKTVKEIEDISKGITNNSDTEEQYINKGVTIECVVRNKKRIDVTSELILEKGDSLLLFGTRNDILNFGSSIGKEINSNPDTSVVVSNWDLCILSKQLIGNKLKSLNKLLGNDVAHGIYVTKYQRDNKLIKLSEDVTIKHGDVISIYGRTRDLEAVINKIGERLTNRSKTDFIFHGFGLAVGLFIGLGVIRFGSIPLTLGSGGGALLSGLLFGWYQSRHLSIGNMSPVASELLRDLGLSGFVTVIGLANGALAIQTIRNSGLEIFGLGVLVTVIPLLLTMLFGRYVLKYNNVAIFAGALAGSRSANPAFGEILSKAGNTVPTTPFAITYALANVFLTLLGPLIVAFS